MTALAIILGILLLPVLMPVGVRAVYDEGFSLYITAFGIPIQIYPGREKQKKQKKKPAKAPGEKKTFDTSSLNGYLELFTRLLGELGRKIRIRELTLHVYFGGSDPALNYGRAWAAIGVTMPLLEELLHIRKHDVGAYFSEGETSLRFFLRAHAVMTAANLLHIALHALREWMKLQKPEKAV